MCMQVLQKICWFVVLAATSSDQVTLLNGTAADKKLDGLPDYKELLQTFITQEVCLPHTCPCILPLLHCLCMFRCWLCSCISTLSRTYVSTCRRQVAYTMICLSPRIYQHC